MNAQCLCRGIIVALISWLATSSASLANLLHTSDVRAASSKTEAVVYRFRSGVGGNSPSGPLLEDQAGNLYGTASHGGVNDNGTIYRLSPSVSGYTFKVLYAFLGGKDGSHPAGPLVADQQGDIFGATSQGGNNCPNIALAGCGIVFELTPGQSGYSEKIVERFYLNILNPRVALGTNKIFGTTMRPNPPGPCTYAELGNGNEGSCGYAFAISPGPNGNSPYNLAGFYLPHGSNPTIAFETTGSNLFGFALAGGENKSGNGEGDGVIFSMSVEANGFSGFSDLYKFKGGEDGSGPDSLVAGANGVIYGTTVAGGGGALCSTNGCGTVFRLTPSAGAYAEQVLYRFTGADGSGPTTLVYDRGLLIGSATGGINGGGTLFELAPSSEGYSETTLYRFGRNANNALNPGALTLDPNGTLFGIASGGFSSCSNGYCGTIFKITP